VASGLALVLALGGCAGVDEREAAPASIGGALAPSMAATDREQSERALETKRTGQAHGWTNPDTRARFEVVPTRTYQAASGTPCREYCVEAWLDGVRRTATGAACREPDGTWRAI
jgi:surface antigen